MGTSPDILPNYAEEVGLDGARLFVNNHPWAKNVGIALNFEARGSGGPMIPLKSMEESLIFRLQNKL